MSLPATSLAPVALDEHGPSFADLGLPSPLTDVLSCRGIVEPLPIQQATIVDALAGRDVCGKAPTGSGKTLAFALPVAATVDRGAPRRPRALVLAPTRELAAQITTELGPLLAVRRRRAHAFYGGVGFGPQRQALRRGVDVAVACPGRLLDLVGTGDMDLSDVGTVVLDEADRMADMGFLPAVRRILDATRTDRQTLLFSATLDGDVDVLIRRYQRDPARHEVTPPADHTGGATHRFDAVDHGDRIDACVELVSTESSSIVFVRTKHGADRLATQLGRRGVSAAAIHGGRSQAQRDRALAAFRGGTVRALVATDVAARGIHVDDVACVVHFDLPADHKDYVHRSGRTARAGAGGTVVALVTPEQAAAAAALHRALDLPITGSGAPSAGAPARRPAGAGRPARRRRPTGTGERRPAPTTGDRRPGPATGQRPTTAGTGERRATDGTGQRPTTAGTGERRPGPATGQRPTTAGAGERRPTGRAGAPTRPGRRPPGRATPDRAPPSPPPPPRSPPPLTSDARRSAAVRRPTP